MCLRLGKGTPAVSHAQETLLSAPRKLPESKEANRDPGGGAGFQQEVSATWAQISEAESTSASTHSMFFRSAVANFSDLTGQQ